MPAEDGVVHPYLLANRERSSLGESSGESESVERAVVEPGNSADSPASQSKNNEPASVRNLHVGIYQVHTEGGLPV